MHSLRRALFGFFSLSFVAANAGAQVDQPVPSPAPSAQPSEEKKLALDPEDPFIPVEDPMLAPVPAPTQLVTSWQAALELVKARSPDLRAAHAQIEVAHGRARMTLASSLPKLTGTGSLTHQLIMPANDPAAAGLANFFPATVFTARAELLVPLLSARNWYDYATAKEVTEKTALDVAETERRVIAGLAEAIVQVVTAERLAEVTRLNLASALSTLELNKRRAALGAATTVDVLRAEQEVARSRATIIQSDEALRQAREALGRAMGYSEPWGVTPSIRLDRLREDTERTCVVTEKLEDRSDLRAARAAEKIAERNVKSVDRSFIPTINGQTAFVYSTNNFATGSRGPIGWSIGAVLSWPLYEGGLRYGEKRQNEGLLEVARQQSLDAQRNAELQISQSERGVEVALQNLEVSRLGQQIAQNSAKMSRIQFVNGSGSSFDMIETQKSAREAEIDVTVKEFQLLRAEIIAFLARATCQL